MRRRLDAAISDPPRWLAGLRSRYQPAWYREALGLTHEAAAGVPGGVAFMVAPTGERLDLLAVDVQPSTWDGPIAALRAGVPQEPGQSMNSTTRSGLTRSDASNLMLSGRLKKAAGEPPWRP